MRWPPICALKNGLLEGLSSQHRWLLCIVYDGSHGKSGEDRGKVSWTGFTVITTCLFQVKLNYNTSLNHVMDMAEHN